MEKERAKSGEKTNILDAIVVLGKNLGIGWTSKEISEQRFHLSSHSRISVLAAGILYREGYTKNIVFSVGKTGGSELSEAELMKRHLLRIFPSIPEGAVLVQDISWDTNTDGKMLKRILDKYNLRRVGLVTVGFHVERAEHLLERAGINLDELFASDWVLKQKREKFVKNYQSSECYNLETARERKGLKVMRAPFAPEVLSAMTGLFTRKVGPRRLLTALTPLTLIEASN